MTPGAAFASTRALLVSGDADAISLYVGQMRHTIVPFAVHRRVPPAGIAAALSAMRTSADLAYVRLVPICKSFAAACEREHIHALNTAQPYDRSSSLLTANPAQAQASKRNAASASTEIYDRIAELG